MSLLPKEVRAIPALADDHADLFLDTVRAAMERRRWELGADTLEDLDDEQLAAVIEAAVEEAGEALGRAA
jgi:hypothetical protein